MDVSSAAFLKPTNPFCRVSSLKPHSTSSSPSLKNPLRRNIGPSILFLKIPSWSSFAARRDEFLEISAHFRRPSRRRNRLREKLVVPREEQVREFSNPDSNSENSSYSLDSLGKSNLWNKLENWVDQYKGDSEYWGIGTGPIFTVYQDTIGNVNRVSVNLDEIAKRYRVRAWSPGQKETTEEFKDLDFKISRAEMMAKEIETGEFRLPRNSSIAKFVIEGKRSSFVDGFRSVSLRGELFVKLFPRIGFTMLCGCCVFWAVKKLFVGKIDEPGLTREEVEMLRRKKKSRMEREELEKGSVQVIQDAPELPMRSSTRPQLDKNELMKSIEHAKASKENMFISDSSGHFNANDRDFVDKVREIRQMARKARELEWQDHSEVNKEGEGDDASSTTLAAERKDLTIMNKDYLEIESVNNRSDHDSISEIDSLVDQAVVIDIKRKLVKNNMDGVKSNSDGEGQMNIDTVTVNVNGQEMNREITLGVATDSIAQCNNPSTSSVDVLRNKEKVGQNKIASTILGDKESNSNICRISVRKKPKIIRSVKEAQEYLAEKRRMATESLPPKQKVQLKRLPRGDDSFDSIHDDKLDDKASLIVNNSPKAVGPPKVNTFQVDDTKSNRFSMEIEVQEEKHENFQYDTPDGKSEKPLNVNGVRHSSFFDDFETGKIVHSSNILLGGYANNDISKTLRMANSVGEHKNIVNQTRGDGSTRHTSENKQALESPNTSSDISSLGDGSVRVTPGTIKPFKEDGESNDTSNKGHPDQEAHVRRIQDSMDFGENTSNEPIVNKDQNVRTKSKKVESSESDNKPDNTLLAVNSSEESTSNGNGFPLLSERAGTSGDPEPSILKTTLYDSEDKRELKGLSWSETSFSQVSDVADCHSAALPPNIEKSWTERNFQQFDPIIKKIGIGFNGNYMVAKEKVQEQPSLSPEISELGLMEDDGELDWMNNESLCKIVFQVRENELAGRDPFHLMDAHDQQAFFQGLECKAEKVNEKLLGLHEWVHSRIENLDYGADGISLDDPLKKIIPRWKGPSYGKDPEFLGKFSEIQTGNRGNSHAEKEDTQSILQKPEELPTSSTISPYSTVNGRRKVSPDGYSKHPKTLIESSDGSSRPGKKRGKEHWQHTKKWSQGFLEIYNAEKDPEIKSIMKDMGKDLDRWITEKEAQDVTDLMTRIPKRKRRYIEKKMDKLKREMKMFGPQAVVSKYKEYSDEKEEDYLWWLDLRFVLCIELYTIEDDIPKVGFYSLEMAEDLELNPKQHHVIAFEDPGDSKNFCYIVQAHMDILGSGRAFVVARPPKDAFREAKANGFNVTVIRKGEVKLNVDKTLEEVEEEITEIGSKIYHDKIMHERSVDMRALMKGVISADKSTKRTSKPTMMKKAAKSKDKFE